MEMVILSVFIFLTRKLNAECLAAPKIGKTSGEGIAGKIDIASGD
jgi:hypothetical protein